jgi:hypothetical protein
MATYYVSSGSGDNTDNGTTPALAKKTMAGALALSLADGDTIEIIDEETYPENAITISTPNLTIIHTASHLGRPKIDGIAGTKIWNNSTSGTIFQGLEMYNASYAIHKNTTNGGWWHLTGCFVHNVNYLPSHAIVGNQNNKTSINECVLYFEDAGVDHINVSSDVTFRNCLITASLSNEMLVRDFGDSRNSVTASFCTFINTPGGSSTDPIIQVGKAINCIVSGSGDGIASDDHTYNLVIASGANFRNHADSSNGSAGTGDGEDRDPAFVDKTAIGSGPEIAANFKLQSSSPCVSVGTLYDNITTDISGTTRAQRTWTDYSTPAESNFAGTLTTNLYNNASVQYRRPGPVGRNDIGAYEFIPDNIYEGTVDRVDQVPFSLATKGAAGLRGRSIPYCVSRGGDPSIIIETSSV